MQLKKLLEKWDLNSLKIKTGFLEMEWVPRDEDKTAAWSLYVELLTRVATQRLTAGQGTEIATLNSIHQLFPLTREIIKDNGRHCMNFTKIAVVVLNQKVRPFTTKWHGRFDIGGALDSASVNDFRSELFSLQSDLRNYMRLLADMADIEDITDLEE
jgi:hypothetical protein